MASYPIAPPPEEEALLTEELKETLLERPADTAPEQSAPPPGDDRPAEKKRRELFSDSLLELSTTRPSTRTVDFFGSFIVHGLLLCALVLAPLYFTEAIDLKQFTQTFLVQPPPPPAPPPSPVIAKTAAAPRRLFTAGGKLLAPTVIPAKVAMIKEEELPPEVGTGIAGGVPGGVPGGQVGGVIGGIISDAPRTYIPVAPTSPAPKAPIRVGGRFKAPRANSTPDPIYPPLARQAKIQGDVVIDAVIDTNGDVVEMKLISGHPLLIPAAMQTLRRWKYQPTYLDEEPVAVQLVVTVKFRLGI